MQNKTDNAAPRVGRIVGVGGAVADVLFDGRPLPAIREAPFVRVGNERGMVGVSRHTGGGIVRCSLIGPA